MKVYRKDELLSDLRLLGIGEGDIVHVQSDLRRIGLVDAPLTRDGLCGFYLDALKQVVGPEGTISVCTAFEDYGRYGTPFDRQTSPSRTDTLSEYVRTQEGAIRSIHPIVSVTALGARAMEISGGPHFEGFGYQSAWGRLHRANAKILSLGLGPNLGGTTFFHYVDRLYGVPYTYTKIYRHPVRDGHVTIEGVFTMAVRYLDFDIVNTPVRIKNALVAEGSARVVKTGRAESWCCPAQLAAATMMKMLDHDRWVFVERPPSFREGEIPWDGLTGPMVVNPSKTKNDAVE